MHWTMRLFYKACGVNAYQAEKLEEKEVVFLGLHREISATIRDMEFAAGSLRTAAEGFRKAVAEFKKEEGINNGIQRNEYRGN